jgi:hypothetical protein
LLICSEFKSSARGCHRKKTIATDCNVQETTKTHSPFVESSAVNGYLFVVSVGVSASEVFSPRRRKGAGFSQIFHSTLDIGHSASTTLRAQVPDTLYPYTFTPLYPYTPSRHNSKVNPFSVRLLYVFLSNRNRLAARWDTSVCFSLQGSSKFIFISFLLKFGLSSFLSSMAS